LKKTFCLDTNVLLYDPRSIFSFGDNDVIIPLVVLEELDKQKTRQDEVGKNARTTNRILDDLRTKGNLSSGIKLDSGGTLKIVTKNFSDDIIPPELDGGKNDNLIISHALEISKKINGVFLITKDISMRLKCDALGVPCEDYLKHRVAGGAEQIFGGLQVILTSGNNIDKFYASSELKVESIENCPELLPNEFVVLKNHDGSSGSALARNRGNMLKPLVYNNREFWGIKPKNKEQTFATDILLDAGVDLVSLIGPAGTGKTLLALAAGLEQTLEKGIYKKLIVSKPVIPVGKDIGYLPGTKEEKMAPWIQPIRDNLEFLIGSEQNDTLNMLFEQGTIEVEAMTYIRGRSIPKAFIIIDEAQNLSVHELKTIITRCAEGTKIVLTGDIDQIDNNLIDAVSNGLTYAVEKFKHYDIAGHITMLKGERSRLASLAAEIL